MLSLYGLGDLFCQFSEQGVPIEEVYSISQRLTYEQAEHEARRAATTPDAIEERKAIQGEA